MKTHCNAEFYYERPFMDISSVHKRFVAISDFADTSHIEDYPKQVFYWSNGSVYRAYCHNSAMHEEEFMYIHFQKRPNFEVFFNPDEVNEFYITSNGFYQKAEVADEDSIKRYNPFPGKAFEDVEFEKYKREYMKIRLMRLMGNLRAYIHI